ncbi:hypothetical protein PLICBS_008840 [Purpureocillium lilacinum]|uniref:uncharacterized protein n=1 Tax=Purpureocillium lilacinum TaxID=33203 RepID=UPI00207E3FCB|nr:hypothetical protein PLICBS_008840 [Purpureocillium lilacinum]
MLPLLLLVPTLLLGASSAVLVPPPPGPSPVALAIVPLTDPSRRDDGSPLTSSSSSSHSSSPEPIPRRRILTSVFVPLLPAAAGSAKHPSCEGGNDTSTNGSAPWWDCGNGCRLQTLPYMTRAVAASYGAQAAQYGLPEDLYSRFEMQTCDPAYIPSPRPPPARCSTNPSRCRTHHTRRTNNTASDDTSCNTTYHGNDGNDDANDKTGSGGRRCRTGRGGKAQLIVLTPGLSESRLLYSALARSLASTTGLPVVTVDHPFEAQPGVEFPDGSVVPGLNVSGDDEAALSRLVKVRADDISFLLHNIATLLAHLPSPLRQHLLHIHHHLGHHSPPRALIIGHSLGGSAAAALLLSDPSRAVAAINLDGRVVFPAASVAPLSSLPVPIPVTNEQKKDKRHRREARETGYTREETQKRDNSDSKENKGKKEEKKRQRPGPLVQLGRPNHRAEDPTWNATWPILNGGGGSNSSSAGGPTAPCYYSPRDRA